MSYLGEFIAFGIDSIIFGICLRKHFYCRKSINAVEVSNLYNRYII
jgi:E3 ubiquitin-protein ligase MUL1